MNVRLVILIVLTASVPVGLRTQTTTSGSIAGVVTDPSDAPVPGANVQLKDNAKGTIQATSTNAEGGYLFPFLAPSIYTLMVIHPGFQIGTRTVSVLLGPPATVNVRLAITSQRSEMTVTGEVPLIRAENGDVSTTMNQVQVSEVPNPGGDLTYIAQTAPGAIMNTEGGGDNFSIMGMPAFSNLFTVNGMNYDSMDFNGSMSGALNLLLGQNQVQEATVVSNGYSGQYGSVAGTNINYITKSGGNGFHGNAQYFWNGRLFNANDWFDNAAGNPRPFDNVNQWAGAFGGPIKKDKLFFFFDTEGLRILIVPQSFPILIPSPQFEEATIANIDSLFGHTSASDAFYRQIFNLYNGAPGANRAQPGGLSPADPTGCTKFIGPNGLGTTVPCALHFQPILSVRPSDESFVSGRVDWIIRPIDRLFLLIQYDHGFQASYTDPISSLFNVHSNQPWWQGQLNETHTFGNLAANQILLAGWNLSDTFGPTNLAKTLAAFPTQLAWNSTNTFATLGGSNVISGGSITQYQISDDFEKTFGNHKLLLGIIFNGADQTILTPSDHGTLVPQTVDAFFQGGLDRLNDPTQNFTELSQGFSSVVSEYVSYHQLGLYSGDEWNVQPNLKLTFAIRAEHQSNPACRKRCFAQLSEPFESISHDPNQPYNDVILTNQKNALKNLDPVVWMPRFGFAWQPLGVSHNTVIRGGVGLFFDPVPPGLSYFLGFNPPLINHFAIFGNNIAPTETTSLFKDAANSNMAFVNGFFAGETLEQIQASVLGFSPPGLNDLEKHLHSPQYQKWSLELQQAIGTNTSMSIGYYGNHGFHGLVQNPSANAFGFDSLPAALCTAPPIPPCADPRFSQVNVLSTIGVSNYNGMIASFQHRFTRWTHGIFQTNYTYSHAFDEVSDGGLLPFTHGSSLSPQDPNNIRGAYGPAEYDVRHSFNANYVWEVPVKAALHGHGPDYLVKGWQVSGTIFAHTGFPYTVFDSQESNYLAANNNYFSGIYAVPAGALRANGPCGVGAAYPSAPNPCLPSQTLADGTPSPNALFVQAGCETGFNSGTLPGPSNPCGGAAVQFAQGRNRFRGPSYFNTDFAVMKNTKTPGWEKGELGIGFQFFNFFNHPNFQLPDNSVSDPTLGWLFSTTNPPTSILGYLGGNASPRMIQLKAQLRF